MFNRFSRRKILKIASGLVAGATTAFYFPSLANLVASPNKSKGQNPTPGTKQVSFSTTVNNRLGFVGPFPSWSNLKTDYQAIGDGIADDTQILQQALNELGSTNHSPVLYLPAGIYLITQTLTMTSPMNISIIGESPDQTIIKWDGPQSGTMLYLNGIRYSKFSRLTFDGNSKALVAVDQSWDGKVPNFDTGNEYSDIVFQDVGYGIQAGNLGQGAAEGAVLRCQFLRNSKAGLITKNFNALDWFIWYSLFQDCNIGVTNEPGAGNFHVFESVFLNSQTADVLIKNTVYFSIRNNFSFNSKAFFIANFVGMNGALTTIQGNTIIDTIDTTAIDIQNFGPILVLDNTIRSRQGAQGPVAKYRTFAPEDLLSVGNTFTVDNPEDIGARYITFDNTVVVPEVINPSIPTLPAPLPQLDVQVFEVPIGSSGTVIQNAIDAAVKKGGPSSVVHLPAGNYPIKQTLIIPAGSDVQLVGDGDRTLLIWAGTDTGPVLQLNGPNRATLRDFRVSGAAKSNGIVVNNEDQPRPGLFSKPRIFMEQVFLDNAIEYNLLVDRLDYTNVELHDFYHSDSKGTSIKVIGGLQASKGVSLGGATNIFGGASSNNQISYAVTDGGTLLARDIWYESAKLPGFALLTGKGTFTLHGANMETLSAQAIPAVEFNNFDGKATFLDIQMTDRFVVNGDGNNTNILVWGIQGHSDSYIVNNSDGAKAAVLNSRKYGKNGSEAVPNQANTEILPGEPGSVAFLRDMLFQTRSQRPKPLTSLPAGLTDVVFERVRVENSLIGIHLQ